MFVGYFMAAFLLAPCWFVAAVSRRTARKQQGNSKQGQVYKDVPQYLKIWH
jgi:hypothetical protein